MSNPLVEQGVNLMLYGMGTVVVFLSLMVVATRAMSGMITRWFPEQAVPVKPAKSARPTRNVVPEKTLLIIQEAIAQHRQR